jgi:hypothetical protein
MVGNSGVTKMFTAQAIKVIIEVTKPKTKQTMLPTDTKVMKQLLKEAD